MQEFALLGLFALLCLLTCAAFNWWGMDYTDRLPIGLILVVIIIYGGYASVYWGISLLWGVMRNG